MVNLRIPEGVDVLESRFLFVEAFAEQPRGVGVKKMWRPVSQLLLQIRESTTSGSRRLHQPSLKVEKAQQSSRVFADGILSTQLPPIQRESIRIRCLALFRRRALVG
jgi:hypothetical protein